jgi:hypothetical protein
MDASASVDGLEVLRGEEEDLSTSNKSAVCCLQRGHHTHTHPASLCEWASNEEEIYKFNSIK